MAGNKNNKVLNNKCPGCGSPIHFNIKLGKWKCEHCKTDYTLSELQKFNNASSKIVNLGSVGDDTQYDSYNCQNCGAEIIADEHTASTFCVYCGNTAILKTKLSGKFAPTKIIPFKKEKEDAVNAFKGLKKFRPLLPNGFISQKNIDKITGLYIPFWLFNIVVEGKVTYKANKIQTWAASDIIRSEKENYEVERGGTIEYSLIPVDASSRFSNEIMNTIEPFNYNEMVDYNHAYLSGFLSKKYDVNIDASEVEAMNRAKNSAEEKFKSTIMGYNEVREYSNTLITKRAGYEYALLPIYMVNVKYKQKFYTFVMNGQTGEFIGDMPISVPKLVVYSILLFVLVFVLIIILSYIRFLMVV